MEHVFASSVLLGRSHELPRGPRVRLRLPGPRDAEAIRELYAECGLDLGELCLARLVGFDPRTRVVICATALVDNHEAMVGIGAIDLGQPWDREPVPQIIVCDGDRAAGLGDLLERALVGRARELTAARAA